MGYARIDIKVVPVTKNMTRLLQPLDLTNNASVKKMEKRGFSDYFTSTIIHNYVSFGDIPGTILDRKNRWSFSYPLLARLPLA